MGKKAFTVRIPEELHRKVELLAKQMGLSKSKFVEQILRERFSRAEAYPVQAPSPALIKELATRVLKLEKRVADLEGAVRGLAMDVAKLKMRLGEG